MAGKAAKSAPKLTAKQEIFCKEYLIDLNGTQAAIRAGYSVLVKPRRTLLSENFHTPMDSFHCWLYEAV